MTKLALTLSLATLTLGMPHAAIAQDQGPPQLYYLVQEFVKPPMTQQYETAGKAFLKDLAATAKAKETIQFTTVSGPEVGYIYVVPVDGWAGLSQAFQDWEAASQAMGQEKWMQHMAHSSATVDHSATSIMMARDDLSYLPQSVALTPDRPYRHYTWWYVVPGKETDIEAVAKEYIALYRSKNIQTGWRVYQEIVGPDLPMYLVVSTAADEASFHAEEKRIREMTGAEGQRLEQKAMQFARRLEINDSWIRLDLSFPPVEQQVGARP